VPKKSTSAAVIEATVTSQGQFTLHRAARTRTGSRNRFTLPPGGFASRPVPCELEDLWALADQAGKPRPVMNFDEMNRAKARRPGSMRSAR
jgi:hypothetical protein